MSIDDMKRFQKSKNDMSSLKLIHRAEENDPTLTELMISTGDDECFDPSSNVRLLRPSDSSYESAYNRLGGAIAGNLHLRTLTIHLLDDIALDITDREFFDGLLRNSSIKCLELGGDNNALMARLGPEVLGAYHANNNLTRLSLVFADMRNGDLTTTSLRCCTCLETLHMVGCNITDEQLLQIVGAIRGHYSLEEVKFPHNRIGNAGCEALATLFEDPNCNIHTLSLANNQVSNDGAIAIANSLTNNNKLRDLRLQENSFNYDTQEVHNAFEKLLCNTSSISATFSSNHTLQKLYITVQQVSHLTVLLQMNEDEDKSIVAKNKICIYHPQIMTDMKPFYKWDKDGERTLKALPYVVDWLKKAIAAIQHEVIKMLAEMAETPRGRRCRDRNMLTCVSCQDIVSGRYLSAIYQFARTMPLLFEPISRMEVDEND